MGAAVRVAAAAGTAAEAGAAVLTVPGNLLLLGEYAVLEPGGLGIAVAIERRVALELEAAKELTVIDANTRGTTWKSANRGQPSLVSATIGAVERELSSRGCGSGLPSLGLRIDSSPLFGADGKKIGLGSSAAVAVGIAYALLSRAGLGGAELEASTFRVALAGHRSYQGGRGSGYDVAVSIYGGFGLFTGGARPSFERLELAWMPPFSLTRGPAPVDTAGAVRRYELWKRRAPAAAIGFLQASNAIVRGFAEAGSWDKASRRLREGARLSAWLGESIGVPASLNGLGGRLNSLAGVAKTIGAGDELAAVWPSAASPPGTSMDIEVAKAGPLWSE